MIEEILGLLEKMDEAGLIELLKTLTPEEKKKLTPGLKKAVKEAHAYVNEGGSYGPAKPEKLRHLAQLVAFVCFNRTDYERNGAPTRMLIKEWADKVLDWYCPSWFSDYMNSFADPSSFWLPGYAWLMELTERGFLRPEPALIARALPDAILTHLPQNKWEYRPERLLRRPVTLAEHVWYLFQFETHLSSVGRYQGFRGELSRGEVGWEPLFKDFSSRGLIDRDRLLRESLLAGHRNFNQSLSGWFAGLFETLEPAPAELMAMQRELFIVLSAPATKPVNAALRALKKIVREPGFNAEGLLDAAPLLLASDTKSIVTATLGLLEDLGKAFPALRSRIALLTVTVFLHPVDELQNRAARLIVNVGDPTDPTLRNELFNVRDNLLSAPRKSLDAFLDKNSEVKSPEADSTQAEAASIPIAFPATIDDLIFLASQAFDNNKPWHFDLLPAALVRFAPELQRANLTRLEPAFQRAIGVLEGGFRAELGHLDWLLALFFIDFGNWLIDRNPGAAAGIDKIIRSADSMKDGKRASYRKTPAAGSYTAIWKPKEKREFYLPFQTWLLEMLRRIHAGNRIPALSTPTHEPGWIAPEVLVDRLADWQADSRAPSGIDWEIALARCYLPTALPDLDRLSGEPRRILEYLFYDKVPPRERPGTSPAWLVAALSRSDRPAAQSTWSVAKESFTYNTYSSVHGKMVEQTAHNIVLRAVRQEVTPNDTGKKGFLSRWLDRPAEKEPMLYDFLRFSAEYVAAESMDIRRILSLTPNHPEPILIDVINHCLKESKFLEEPDRKMATATAQFLFEIWRRPDTMSLLFLGCCLVNADKTLSSLAAETWLRAVSAVAMDNRELGRILGKLEKAEYAPLKRLTDLMSLRLFKVSAVHNEALERLIGEMLPELPEKPMIGMKRLLQIQAELEAMKS